MKFGGFYIGASSGRVQIPVIVDPSDSDIDVVISIFFNLSGVLGLRIDPLPDVGPYELKLYAESGNFFIALSSYLVDGDHCVRTFKEIGSEAGAVVILGEEYPSGSVTRDVELVRRCFKEFLHDKNIKLPFFED